jgi:hypothetical protein
MNLGVTIDLIFFHGARKQREQPFRRGIIEIFFLSKWFVLLGLIVESFVFFAVSSFISSFFSFFFFFFLCFSSELFLLFPRLDWLVFCQWACQYCHFRKWF